jgi:hypothetical protein
LLLLLLLLLLSSSSSILLQFQPSLPQLKSDVRVQRECSRSHVVDKPYNRTFNWNVVSDLLIWNVNRLKLSEQLYRETITVWESLQS